MKRRNFIRTTAIGAISLGMYSPEIIASPITFKGASIVNWLGQLGWAFSGRRRSEARFASEAFAKLASTTNEVFAKLGYLTKNDDLYFFGKQEDWCFYPLMMRHTAFGTPPFVVPVFHREGDNWHRVVVLDGFEIEAITRACEALAEKEPEALQNLLVPIGRSGSNPGTMTYKTRDGIVAIKTVQRGGKAQTTCTVTGHEGTVFSETFDSRHCRIA